MAIADGVGNRIRAVEVGVGGVIQRAIFIDRNRAIGGRSVAYSERIVINVGVIVQRVDVVDWRVFTRCDGDVIDSDRSIVHRFDGQRHRLRRFFAARGIRHRVAKGLGAGIVLIRIEGVVATGGEVCCQCKRAIGQTIGTIIVLGQAFSFERISQRAI